MKAAVSGTVCFRVIIALLLKVDIHSLILKAGISLGNSKQM